MISHSYEFSISIADAKPIVTSYRFRSPVDSIGGIGDISIIPHHNIFSISVADSFPCDTTSDFSSIPTNSVRGVSNTPNTSHRYELPISIADTIHSNACYRLCNPIDSVRGVSNAVAISHCHIFFISIANAIQKATSCCRLIPTDSVCGIGSTAVASHCHIFSISIADAIPSTTSYICHIIISYNYKFIIPVNYPICRYWLLWFFRFNRSFRLLRLFRRWKNRFILFTGCKHTKTQCHKK